MSEKIRKIFARHLSVVELPEYSEIDLAMLEKEVLAAVAELEQAYEASCQAYEMVEKERDNAELRLSEIRKPDFLEKLAALGHEQLAHWVTHEDDITKQGFESWQRWLKQAQTPYEQLSNEEKEYDREWARKVLKLLDGGEQQ